MRMHRSVPESLLLRRKNTARMRKQRRDQLFGCRLAHRSAHGVPVARLHESEQIRNAPSHTALGSGDVSVSDDPTGHCIVSMNGQRLVLVNPHRPHVLLIAPGSRKV